MTSGDPLAANLFERLSRYSPRQGAKRKREPLEDFMTEALAYFLIQSRQFQTQFLSLVLDRPKHALQSLDIGTQDQTGKIKGRADLTIIPRDEQLGRIGIEVKRHAPLQPRQLHRMVESFEHPFLLAPDQYIRDKAQQIKETGVYPISWERVHKLLVEVAPLEIESNSRLLTQFATFLESKGYAHITMHSNPMKISSITDAARVLDEWTRILSKVRSALRMERSGQYAVPRWTFPNAEKKNTSSYYGICGPGDSYAEFEITQSGRVYCIYEENCVDRHPNEKLPSSIGRGGGKLYFDKRKRYPDSKPEELSNDIVKIFVTLQTEVRAWADEWRKKAR